VSVFFGGFTEQFSSLLPSLSCSDPSGRFFFSSLPVGSAGVHPGGVAKSYQRECLHCKELFDPGIRHRWRQKFCTKPGCRTASKAASQRRWLSKPENRDHFNHFRGSANVERVRRWREANPGYKVRTVIRSRRSLRNSRFWCGCLLRPLKLPLLAPSRQAAPDSLLEVARLT
jgi:hypothetical protein